MLFITKWCLQNIPVGGKLYQGKLICSVSTFTDTKTSSLHLIIFVSVFCFYLAQNDFFFCDVLFCFHTYENLSCFIAELSVRIFLNTGRKYTSASRPYYFSENGKWWSNSQLQSKYLKPNKVIKQSWTWSQNSVICFGIIFDCNYYK